MRSLSCKGIHFDKFFLAFPKGADEATLNAAMRVVAPAESVVLYIHKNADDDVDGVHLRHDGKAAPDKWWMPEQPDAEEVARG